VPGVSQDWLVRPIRRGDLLRAKLIFVVLVVEGPALLADLRAWTRGGIRVSRCPPRGALTSLLMLLVFELAPLRDGGGDHYASCRLPPACLSSGSSWSPACSPASSPAVVPHRCSRQAAFSGWTPAFWSVLATARFASVIIPLQ
jgi:hypothetical protein